MRIALFIITYFICIPLGNSADYTFYKETCSDIGFTPDTDPFAECVLEFYKRDKITKVVKEEKQQKNIEIELEKKRQFELENLRAKQRQAQYDQDKRRAEIQRQRQEDARARQEANRQQEMLDLERRRYELESRRAQQQADAIDQQNRLKYLQMIPGFVDMMNPAPAPAPAPTNRTMNCESVTTNLPNSPAQIICR
jgi:hypothetical protein